MRCRRGRRRALVLAVHPLLVGFVALTNDGTGLTLLGVGGHDLMYEAVEMWTDADGTVDWGVGFWVHTAYSYVLVLASTVLVLQTTFTSNETYRFQSATVTFAFLVPLLSNVLDLFVDGVDGLLALGFGASGILLTISIQRYELSTVAPVTRRDVMEAVADGVLVVDADGRIVDSNDRARFLLGLDDGGRVFVVRDVTEQHAYRRELERKTERLDRFASVVRHDLRNPLSVAQGYASIAEEAADGNADAFDRVHDAHDRMEDLIEDVLLVAREGETSTGPEPVALADLAERAWSTVGTPTATLHVDDAAALEADPDRTVKLFENLFRTAIEHGRANGSTRDHDGVDRDDRECDGVDRDDAAAGVAVTVGALADADGFYVADDGPGIDPDVRDDLFETGITGSDSTGLGLAIVERIADAHGWRVDAGDAANGGARFDVRGVDRASDADVATTSTDPIPDDRLSS